MPRILGFNTVNNAIVNADVNTAAAIAGSKIVAATSSVAGVVSTGAQTFAGAKTFSGNVRFDAAGTSMPARIELRGTNSTAAASQQVFLESYQPSGGASTDAALDIRVRKSGDGFNSPTTIATLTGGNVGIATTAPTEKLDVDGNTIRIRTARTPASASATGTVGSICWDANYIYVCTATNTWKRTAIDTWV